MKKRRCIVYGGAYIAVLTSSGCASLGPLPTVTGASAVPVANPGVELQAAAVPGFFLSDAVKEEPDGQPIRQASMLIEPGELIEVPGLSGGGRYAAGHGGDGYFEPMLRYRFWLDEQDRIGVAFVGYGTHASGEENGASYNLTRGGLEVGADIRVTPLNRWAELHVVGGSSLMALAADGRYCMSTRTGFGLDCPDRLDATTAVVEGDIAGLYPTFFTGAAFDFGRHLDSAFHGVRVAGWLGGGYMPRLKDGEESDPRGFAQAGLGLSLALGGT